MIRSKQRPLYPEWTKVLVLFDVRSWVRAPVVGISSLGVCPSDLRAVVGASLDGKVTEGGDVDSIKKMYRLSPILRT